MLVSASIMGLSLFFVFSCKKAAENTNTQTAADNAICEGEFMRVLPTANSIAVKSAGNGVGRVTGGGYPTVSVDTTHGWPHILTINYGPSPGVTDSSDGKTRSGLMVMQFSNYWHIPGSIITINLDAASNYMVNGVQYQGVITLTRNSATSFSVNISNAKCTKANPAWTILYSATRTYTWTSGYNDSIPSNDVFSITGSASGTDRNGVNYDMKINSPIIKTGDCPYITQGNVTISTSNNNTYTVDFGNGNCDNQATVTINGNSFPITL